MAQVRPTKEPFILQDRLLLAGLLFASSGYVVIGSWPGVVLLVAAFMIGATWAFRTAVSHPQLGFRLLATALMIALGSFLTVYVAANEGLLH